MLIITVSLLILLALFDRAMRLERIWLVHTKTRFRFFAIRDELRRLGRRGEIEQDRWFSFMDTTLTRSIVGIEAMTVWHAMAFMFVCDMRRIAEAEENRREAMAERPRLAEIYSQYTGAIGELIRERHALLWRVLGGISRGVTAVGRYRQKMLAALQGSPETSTLLQYAC